MTTATEENEQAIQFAIERAPEDMILIPVEVTGASLYQKVDTTSTDLPVQGVRWYIQVDLRNMIDDSTAAALYRVWKDGDQWKALRVHLM